MASISKSSRSLRRKTMPVPAAAGSIRRVTLAPLCSPMPLHSTGARTVCSNGKLFQLNRLHRQQLWPMLYFYNKIVVLPTSSWLIRLLLFYWIDFSHAGVEQRVRGMNVIGDIQDNLLRSGFAVPLDDGHSRCVDPLEFFPVAVNQHFFIALAIARIADRKALLQRQMR